MVDMICCLVHWNLCFTSTHGSQNFIRKWEVVSKQRLNSENDLWDIQMRLQFRGGRNIEGLQTTGSTVLGDSNQDTVYLTGYLLGTCWVSEKKFLVEDIEFQS